MAGDKFLTRDNSTGKVTEVRGTDASTGVGEAGDIVALGTDGKIDLSLLPTSIGPDVGIIETTEALSAGDYVNIYDDAGVERVRLADSTNGRDANGYVKDAFTTGAQAMVYFEGGNDALTGLTPGARYYLTAAGEASTTVPTAPTDDIHQYLGKAVNATTINTDIQDCIRLIA